MNFSGNTVRRGVAGIGAACVLGGLAAATVAAPVASAQPAGCSASDLTGTVSNVTAAARGYLDTHPGANQAVTAAMNQPRPAAEANLRGYFTANPSEYYDLRGILAPLGDAQRNCNVTVLPAELQSAYDTFMAG
ncbi:hemophore-related protein [Mycolicibacterium iranicum]|uniref:Hemophore-related protein n=1 Tax=Mycolicibacterium iranicum TaxID=912594 RepID=A0A839Q1E4_MYCIR|nr:heme-binding protein [Mycolicibacterium iranicum]MBB2989253.1 hemophore-related protein [Mycolicibacterium iranicum]